MANLSYGPRAKWCPVALCYFVIKGTLTARMAKWQKNRLILSAMKCQSKENLHQNDHIHDSDIEI